MIEHRLDEFALLERTARAWLMHPESRRESPSTLRSASWLWTCCLPSFSPMRSWCVSAGEGASVCEVEWDRAYDWRRLCGDPLEGIKTSFSRRPTIRMRQHAIDRNWIERRQAELSEHHVSLNPVESVCGTDGTVRGIGWSLNECRLQWWEAGPAQWRELIAWTLELHRDLDARLSFAPWSDVDTSEP